ncbi:hypothetical protein D3C86_2108150 [compost metagenome]
MFSPLALACGKLSVSSTLTDAVPLAPAEITEPGVVRESKLAWAPLIEPTNWKAPLAVQTISAMPTPSTSTVMPAVEPKA